MSHVMLVYWSLFFAFSPMGALTVLGSKWFVDGLHARSGRMVLQGLGCFAGVAAGILVMWAALPCGRIACHE